MSNPCDVSMWAEEPEVPTACKNCGSEDFTHYMAGMYHQGWSCHTCGKLFWTHNGVPRSMDEIINEYRTRLEACEAEVQRLREDCPVDTENL